MDGLRVYVFIPIWGLKDGRFDTNNFFINQATALKNAGVKPIIISVRFLSVRSLKKLIGYTINNEYEVNGIEIHIFDLFVPIPTLFNSLRDKYISLAYSRILKSFLIKDIRSGQFNSYIIHAHVSHECAYYCLQASKKERIPIVITEHYSGLLTGAASHEDFKRVKKAIESSNEFIFVGSNFKNSICDKLNIKKSVYIIPNMVNTNRFKIREKETESFSFLTAGSLKKNKSMNLVIQAFNNEFNSNENVTLVVAGDGVERENLERLANDSCNRDKIAFLGEYQLEDVGDIFSQADAFVLTSKVETFGIVYVEALFCGVPCIGTKGQGADDIINDNNGLLVNYGDVPELQKAMRYLFDNSDRFNKKGIRKDAVARFSEDSVVNRVISVYNKVIEEGKQKC